ncbi:MAG: type II secretion system F family protein [Acidimicrobiia bacterium]
MTGLVLALLAAYGAHLVYTAGVLGWTGLAPGPAAGPVGEVGARSAPGRRRAGPAGVTVAHGEVLALSILVAGLAGGAGWMVFGGLLPPLAFSLAGSTVPAASRRSRTARRRRLAQESWPRLIEEIRIRATTLGRSIPQALFDASRAAPVELQDAFAEARREWLLATDLERSLDVLRARLADPTVDAVCETLLVAHQVGGGDLDRVLLALVDDRIMDLQGRKDAQSRQAGARFARGFTVVVPLGMALVGLSIGEGREAYGSPTGQALVVLGLGVMAACWLWAGRIMRLPDERRVFGQAWERRG